MGIARDLGELALYDAAFVAAAERSPLGPCDVVAADRAFGAGARRRYPNVRPLFA